MAKVTKRKFSKKQLRKLIRPMFSPHVTAFNEDLEEYLDSVFGRRSRYKKGETNGKTN